MKEIWKKFEDNGLTHSSVHHLMAIYDLLKENGYARGIDVANFLDISRSSVSVTLHKLIAKGYIIEDDNKFYKLSEEGNDIINDVLSTRRIFKKFLMEVLDIEDHLAEEDACKIEHLLSHNTSEKLLNFVKYYQSTDKTSQAFREGFKTYQHKCTDECEMCDDDCFLE